MRPPRVILAGRQNVGKSTLLNALARRHVSIVHSRPGVTRDCVSAVVRLGGRQVELVDTGGLAPEERDELFGRVEIQARRAIGEAEVVVLVTDVRAGPVPGDREVAGIARRAGRAVIVAVNKVDTARWESGVAEFHALGFDDVVGVAAAHRRRLGVLEERILAKLPPAEPAAEEAPALRLAVVGKRNVGKSTFVNALAGAERTLVSEIPGTTRDTLDVVVERAGRTVIVTDTAGLRKRGRVASSAEQFAMSRARGALARADVVLFLLDARERVTDVDRQIGQAVSEQGKACVVALNKWDLVPPDKGPQVFADYVRREMPYLSHAPVCPLSAKEGVNVWEAVDLAFELREQGARKVTTGVLNRAVRDAVGAHPPPVRGTRQGKLYYATALRGNPPRLRLFVNDPELFPRDYRRYLEIGLRDRLPYPDLPLRLVWTGKRPSASHFA